MPEDIIKDLIKLVQNSNFYNKIQIIFDKEEDGSFKTETFYFFENNWGHSVFKEKKTMKQ